MMRTKKHNIPIIIFAIIISIGVISYFAYDYISTPDSKCYTSGYSQDFLRSEIDEGIITTICNVKVIYLGESSSFWSTTNHYSFQFEGFGETSRTMIVSNDRSISLDEDFLTTQYFYSSVLYDKQYNLFSITVRLY